MGSELRGFLSTVTDLVSDGHPGARGETRAISVGGRRVLDESSTNKSALSTGSTFAGAPATGEPFTRGSRWRKRLAQGPSTVHPISQPHLSRGERAAAAAQAAAAATIAAVATVTARTVDAEGAHVERSEAWDSPAYEAWVRDNCPEAVIPRRDVSLEESPAPSSQSLPSFQPAPLPQQPRPPPVPSSIPRPSAPPPRSASASAKAPLPPPPPSPPPDRCLVVHAAGPAKVVAEAARAARAPWGGRTTTAASATHATNLTKPRSKPPLPRAARGRKAATEKSRLQQPLKKKKKAKKLSAKSSAEDHAVSVAAASAASDLLGGMDEPALADLSLPGLQGSWRSPQLPEVNPPPPGFSNERFALLF